MRALTLWPEWAYAVAYLRKDIENRTWGPQRVIGLTIAIHGGSWVGGSKCRVDHRLGALMEVVLMAKRAGVVLPSPLSVETVSAAAASQIVAVATIADLVSVDDSPWFVGPLGWKFANVRALQRPIPIKGALGLWHVPGHIEDQIRDRVGDLGETEPRGGYF